MLRGGADGAGGAPAWTERSRTRRARRGRLVYRFIVTMTKGETRAATGRTVSAQALAVRAAATLAPAKRLVATARLTIKTMIGAKRQRRFFLGTCSTPIESP